ncbi:MAG: hypothetical protein PHV18_09180 [Lachnospiraceae bacterium]|nr:hypothetical protein [Lachnospiraceae bacterium]
MKNIILQPCIWPTEGQEEQLYIRADAGICFDKEKQCVHIPNSTVCSIDTYFNGFSAGECNKYTTVKEVNLEIKLKGSVLREMVCLSAYRYTTLVEDKPYRPIYLAAVICTYKRENYVEDNFRKIEKNILDNPCAPLHGRLSVFVSADGQTLQWEALSQMKIYPNLEGDGGFTRGILEAFGEQTSLAA